jgi:Protein of unknown function (DUF1573)
MKKIFSLLTLALSFGTMANAQQVIKAEPVKPLDIKIAPPADESLTLKETEFDFGKIPQGKPVTHEFVVVNTGKDSLKIVNVQASCGCTTPVWEHDKPVTAGSTTKINVGYNAAAEGPFMKTITITYNGSQTKQIFIKGEVWKTPTESAPTNKAIEGLKN